MLSSTTARAMQCIPAFLVLALIGCVGKDDAAMSISDYWRNPSQMEMDNGWCRANPGERRNLSKCVNAMEANGAWHIYDGLILCRKGGNVDQACVEAFIKRKGM
jgi:hypothetical protein